MVQNMQPSPTGEPTLQKLAQILKDGQRNEEIKKHTMPFLQSIAEELRQKVGEIDASIGNPKSSSQPKEGVQHLDRAYFYLTHDFPSGTGDKRSTLEVAVYLLPKRLWWGIHSWGASAYTQRLQAAFEQLGLVERGEDIVLQSGMWEGDPWKGGRHFALGHELTVQQVAGEDLASLTTAISSDLAGWYTRVIPRLEDLRRILSSNSEMLSRIRQALGAHSLSFTSWQIATFYTALKTKGFVILSGISGTGKTKLAQHFAALLPQPVEDEPVVSDDAEKTQQSLTGENWLFVPVRPDWRDSKSLLGYYNPLTGTYEWTPFLRFLLRAVRSYRSNDGLAWFVVLDEMNLAHVEYYFADLLSVLESGRDEDGRTREPLRLGYPDDAEGDLPPRELCLPPNLYVVGTVNVDETTRTVSPKVLDRAFTLELTEVNFATYPPQVDQGIFTLDDDKRQVILDDFTYGGVFSRVDKQIIADYIDDHPEIRTWLQNLNNLLRPYNLHFGYRVFDEIVSFLAAADESELYEGQGGTDAAFDAAVLMKVLPKFHGSRGKLEAPLRAVLSWCVNPEAPAQQRIEDDLAQIENAEQVAEMLGQIEYQ